MIFNKNIIIIFIYNFIFIFSNYIFAETAENKQVKKIGIFSEEEKKRIFEIIEEANPEELENIFSEFEDFEPSKKVEFLFWAQNDKGNVFRNSLLDYFQKNNDIKDLLKDEYIFGQLIKVIKTEFLNSKEKDMHNQKTLKSILLCLTIVKENKIKELFYETIIFIVFPLHEIRKAAFETLAVLEDDRMLPVLLKLLNSNNSIEKTYAIDAFYYIKDDRIVPLLIRALKDENKSVRYYAIRTLEKMQRTEAIPHFIRIVQSDVNNEIRIKAIKVLGDYQAKTAFSTILNCISDNDPFVREAAIKAALIYNNDNAGYRISQQLAIEDQNHLKLLEIKALLRLKTSGGSRGLLKIITDEKDIKIKTWAIYTTGLLTDYRLFPVLLDNLEAKEPEIMIETAYALGSYGDKKACDNLILILKNKENNYAIQSAALHALKKINNDRTLPQLFELSEKHHNMILKIQIKETISYILNEKY
ncbi:MAG: HEAT repeat domain-containing protein [Spirochaetia bacterium]|nr:HEAT repeat domain-containing protein [Spirochaetia bacterium]